MAIRTSTESERMAEAQRCRQANLNDITPAIDAMRQVKSAGELALMQKAIDASIDAQLDAMKRMRPGLFEYQVAARMKEIHEMAGCSREAYAPIVGTGFIRRCCITAR